ncbi:MAG TPA: hypothetical protein VGK59_13710 [Ohtaekwangia sp.]
MKKRKRKEIRNQIKEGLNLILSSVDINNPSKKLKKLIDAQVKHLSDQITQDLDKMIKKEEKELRAVKKKTKAIDKKANKKAKKKKISVA